MPEYFCVGPSMAADWGDQPPELSRALARRVFGYFAPCWRPALVVLTCIGASAGLGLAPALVTKGLIDYLGNPTQGLGPLVGIAGGGGATAGTAQSAVNAPLAASPAPAVERDPDVPELPFADKPDPSQRGIPGPWRNYPGWVDGKYQGQLVQPTVLLHDSHERRHAKGAVPSGTQVDVELYQPNPALEVELDQPNPVLDSYYVRVDPPSGQQQGWLPAPFLELKLTPPAP